MKKISLFKKIIFIVFHPFWLKNVIENNDKFPLIIKNIFNNRMKRNLNFLYKWFLNKRETETFDL